MIRKTLKLRLALRKNRFVVISLFETKKMLEIEQVAYKSIRTCWSLRTPASLVILEVFHSWNKLCPRKARFGTVRIAFGIPKYRKETEEWTLQVRPYCGLLIFHCAGVLEQKTEDRKTFIFPTNAMTWDLSLVPWSPFQNASHDHVHNWHTKTKGRVQNKALGICHFGIHLGHPSPAIPKPFMYFWELLNDAMDATDATTRQSQNATTVIDATITRRDGHLTRRIFYATDIWRDEYLTRRIFDATDIWRDGHLTRRITDATDIWRNGLIDATDILRDGLIDATDILRDGLIDATDIWRDEYLTRRIFDATDIWRDGHLTRRTFDAMDIWRDDSTDFWRAG